MKDRAKKHLRDWPYAVRLSGGRGTPSGSALGYLRDSANAYGSRVCALPVADVLAGANKAYGHTVHAEPRQASTLRRHEEVGVKAWEALGLTFFG